MKKILFSVLFSLTIAPAAFAGVIDALPAAIAIDEMPVEVSCYEKNSYEFCDFEDLIFNLEKDLDGIEADVANLSVESLDEEMQSLADMFIGGEYSYSPYATIEVKRVVRVAKKLGMDEPQIAKAEKVATRFLEAKKSFLEKKSSLNILLPDEKKAIEQLAQNEAMVQESVKNAKELQSEFAYDLSSDELRIVNRSVKMMTRYAEVFEKKRMAAKDAVYSGGMMKENADMWMILQPVENALWKVQSAESNIESVIFGTHPIGISLR